MKTKKAYKVITKNDQPEAIVIGSMEYAEGIRDEIQKTFEKHNPDLLSYPCGRSEYLIHVVEVYEE